MRDTLKVSGAEEPELNKAVFGIFYVNPADPLKGGTGHTIRVCRTLDVPIAMDDMGDNPALKGESSIKVVMFKSTGHSIYFGGWGADLPSDLAPSRSRECDLPEDRARIGKG